MRAAALNKTLAKMKEEWWYYTVQMHDESIKQGMYPDHMPFLPRIMQKKIELKDMDCLDIGSAEGLLPILAAKGGAKSVITTDYNSENYEKLSYLAHIHNTKLKFHELGQATKLGTIRKSYPKGFDYINLSGLLYHVLSPIDVLAAARSFLKPNGLMLVSTICTVSQRCTMEFNDRGRFQDHWNVFWYLSTGFYEYMLRMLWLNPIDMIYCGDENTGYISVLCRALDHPGSIENDAFMAQAIKSSMEFSDLRKSGFDKLRPSTIDLKPLPHNEKLVMYPGTASVNMFETIQKFGSADVAQNSRESRVLKLVDKD